MPLAIRTYAANPGFPLRLGIHDFYETPDHQLAHDIDGDRRATVPPDGWAAYAEVWNDCAPLVAALRTETTSPDPIAPAAADPQQWHQG
jgi:hypothetical protein